MTARAAVAFGMATHPKPRERLVFRSVMIWTRSTAPYPEHRWGSTTARAAVHPTGPRRALGGAEAPPNLKSEEW